MKESVLHICSYASSYKGNFIESLEFLSKKDDKRNHIYLFPNFANNPNTLAWINQLKTAYLQNKSFFKNVSLLKRIIKENNVTCIFRHFSDKKIDLILKLFFKNIKVIRFFHMMTTPERNCLKMKFKKWVYKKDIFVGVSEPATNSAKKYFKQNNVYTIDNAICFNRLDTIDSFEKSNKTSLMVMGYDFFVKGVDLAIKSCEKVRKKYDIILYIVLATNKQNAINYIEKTYDNIPDWIILLPPTENIGTYYKNTDIFLSPSRTEAFGYAVVESAYCKNSIVATNVDGQAQLKIDGIYWAETENIDSLSLAIENAIKELNIEEKIAQKELTSKLIQERYSIEKWSEKVLELI